LCGNEFMSLNTNLFTNLYAWLAKHFNLNVFHLYNDKKPTRLHNNFIYLLNVDNYVSSLNESNFIVFQGQHNETIKEKVNVILPSCFWTEKSNLFMNCFGLIQKSKLVTYPLKLVRNDWQIIQFLTLAIWDSIEFATHKDVISQLNKYINKIPSVIDNYKFNLQFSLNLAYTDCFQNKYNFSNVLFKSFTSNYYKLTATEKASRIMNSCSNMLLRKKNNFLK
jgi:NADH dehydrogenase/NADH:ubiquinone oxidoreductase subunit G